MSPPPERLVDLYSREYPHLVGLLTVVGGSRSDAEEIAQDAFVRLLENWTRVGEYDSPEGWVRMVALRHLTSRRRRGRVARDHIHLLTPEPAREDSTLESQVDVRRAFQRLSVPHRAVIVLHHLYDLPVDEVARQLKIPVGTVKSRLARAREALGPLLADAPEGRAT